ncbi:AAA family ATPase [Priestia megaterium]|uniref:AAA family ATPase n=1 Tax=Priestia megaterium TaxID=1404 RepID=UPI0011A4B270|nr:ATP-binding protein [Priestia megaterium]
MSTSNFVHVNRPVTKNQYFIGREEIMNYITRGIKNNESIYYAMIGELGMGKTSILNNLCFSQTYKKYNLPNNILFVMVNPLDAVTCGEDFYHCIGESIISAIKRNLSVSIPKELVEYMEESVNLMYQYKHKRQIERVLTGIFQEFFDYNIKIVLMLDDFEKTVQKSKLDYSEFNYLRTLTSGINVNVSYIITSRKDLKFISDAANLSGFSYIFKSTIPYSPAFTNGEIITYIDQYLPDVSLSEVEKREIAILSGGIPNLLRVICSKVLQQKNGGNQLDRDQLLKVILWEDSAYLENLVERNSEDLENILSKGTDSYERAVSINRLFTVGLLKSLKEPFKFTSPIFDLYVKNWRKRQQPLRKGLYQEQNQDLETEKRNLATENKLLEVKKNPLFVHVNRPVTKSNDFVGREEIMKYITNGIKHNESVYYALIGELGMGKTSVINNLCFQETRRKYNLPDSILFVLVDLVDQAASGEDFYRYIGKSIERAIKKRDDVPDKLVDFTHESVEQMYIYTQKKQIERTLTSLFQDIFAHNIKIVLLLDDFEETVQTFNLGYPEFNYLRTLTNAFNINVSYIITSRKDLKSISEAANLSRFIYIFKSAIPFFPTFSDEEVTIYMNKYLSSLRLSGNEREELAGLSGGVPTLLRSICSKVLQDAKNGKGIERDKLSMDVLKGNRDYLESIVEKNKEDFRQVLLKDSADSFEKKISLKRLSTIGVMKDEKEHCTFTSPIFKVYLQKWEKRQLGEEDYLEDESTFTSQLTSPVLSTSNLANNERQERIQDEQDALKNTISNSSIMKPIYQPEELMNLVFKSIKFGRETYEEDATRIVGQKMDHMENRLSNKMFGVEQSITEHLKQINENFIRNFSELKLKYLTPGNEDITLYASKIREQAVVLMQNEQYLAYSKEIATELDHIWEGLEHESREYIMIGELLHHIFDEQKMDLSPVSICYCRAFELELNRKMLPFLKRQAAQLEVKVGGATKVLLGDAAVDHLMLGGYLFVIAKSSEKRQIRKAMEDRGVNTSEFLQSFDKMTKIRNRTAHAERIEINDVVSLKNYLFGGEQRQGIMKNLQSIK